MTASFVISFWALSPVSYRDDWGQYEQSSLHPPVLIERRVHCCTSLKLCVCLWTWAWKSKIFTSNIERKKEKKTNTFKTKSEEKEKRKLLSISKITYQPTTHNGQCKYQGKEFRKSTRAMVITCGDWKLLRIWEKWIFVLTQSMSTAKYS